MENTDLTENIWETKKVCLFKLDQTFAIEETFLREVIFVANVTHVPRVSRILLGLIAARRDIVPLFDISAYLNEEKSSFEQALIMEHQDRVLALAIDSVVGLEDVEVEMSSPSEQVPYLGHFLYQEQKVPLFNFESYVKTLDMTVIS